MNNACERSSYVGKAKHILVQLHTSAYDSSKKLVIIDCQSDFLENGIAEKHQAHNIAFVLDKHYENNFSRRHCYEN